MDLKLGFLQLHALPGLMPAVEAICRAALSGRVLLCFSLEAAFVNITKVVAALTIQDAA